MNDFSIEQEITLLLGECRTMSVATVDQQGNPCAANVQFVADENWRLFWVSSASSVHSTNIEKQSAVALTIYGHDDRPENIHGLQMRGRCEKVVSNEAKKNALEIYQQKFPFVTQQPFALAMRLQTFYCFTPSWWRWIDNRRGFGFKVEREIC